MRTTRILTLTSALTLAAALHAGPATAGDTTPRNDPAPTAAAQVAGKHLVYGWVVGTDGNLWDNVSVTATAVGASTPTASAISYGGYVELWVPDGKYRIVYHDLDNRVPDLDYGYVIDTAGPADKLCLGHHQLTHGTTTNTTKPSVAGPARAGTTLRARPGTWGPTDTALDYTYQWLVGGKTAHYGPTLKLVAGHVGKKVQVRVTAASLTWSATTVTTNAVTVAKSRTTVTATGPTRPVRGTVPVHVTVTDEATRTPWGAVRIHKNGHVLASAHLRTGRNRGTGVAKVAGLNPGKHTLTVLWPATQSSAPSRDTLTVVVR